MGSVSCRFCRADTGDIVLDLGLQPACEYFPALDDPTVDPVFPLRVWLCSACGLAQLADDADVPEQPEGVEPAALARQRSDAVATAHATDLLPAGATLAEGATPHGGSWRVALEELGLRAAAPGVPADVVVDGSFGMMHAADQSSALEALVHRLAPEGVLILQFHTLAAILRERQWNAVRLGHYAYYSAPALQRMLAVHGLTVIHAWSFSLYGGTIMIAARRGGVTGACVTAIVAEELAEGVLDPASLNELQQYVDSSTAAMRRLAEDARGTGATVYGYSAASRSVALVYLAGMDGLLTGVADIAAAKHGCRMPGTTIPVVSPAELVAAKPDLVLMFVSDLMLEVRTALPEIEAGGGHWVDAGTGLIDAAPVSGPSGTSR